MKGKKMADKSCFNKEISTLSVDDEITLLCAFRYALGRMTYVVDTVSQKLLAFKTRASEQMLRVVINDISEQERHHLNGLGMEVDAESWRRVRSEFLQELEGRIKNGGKNDED